MKARIVVMGSSGGMRLMLVPLTAGPGGRAECAVLTATNFQRKRTNAQVGWGGLEVEVEVGRSEEGRLM